MAIDKACEECGTVFVAKTKRARFCGPTCRVRANRRPSKEGAAKGAAGKAPPAKTETAYAAGGLLAQVIADLTKAGVLDTIPGRAAAALAYRIESPMETGAAAASMAKELSRLVEEARALAPKTQDATGQLEDRVQAKLRLVQ